MRARVVVFLMIIIIIIVCVCVCIVSLHRLCRDVKTCIELCVIKCVYISQGQPSAPAAPPARTPRLREPQTAPAAPLASTQNGSMRILLATSARPASTRRRWVPPPSAPVPTAQRALILKSQKVCLCKATSLSLVDTRLNLSITSYVCTVSKLPIIVSTFANPSYAKRTPTLARQAPPFIHTYNYTYIHTSS